MRVEDIVKKAIETLGKGEYRIEPDTMMHEAGLLLLDNTKSKTLLGWSPRLDIDTAIGMTFEWYRAYSDGEDMRSFSLEEIRLFGII